MSDESVDVVAELAGFIEDEQRLREQELGNVRRCLAMLDKACKRSAEHVHAMEKLAASLARLKATGEAILASRRADGSTDAAFGLAVGEPVKELTDDAKRQAFANETEVRDG